MRLRFRGGSAPLADAPLELDETIELEGLSPREVRVTVEVGEWFGETLIVAEGTVALRAGERASLTLELAPVPQLETATASGVVFVAAAWKRTRLDATLELAGVPIGGQNPTRRLTLRRTESARAGYDAFRWPCWTCRWAVMRSK